MHNLKEVLNNSQNFIKQLSNRGTDVSKFIPKLEVFFKNKRNYNTILEKISIEIKSLQDSFKCNLNKGKISKDERDKIILSHKQLLTDISDKKQDIINKIKKIDQNIRDIMKYFPNVSHETTPIGSTSKDNKIISVHNEKYQNYKEFSYIEVSKKINLIDFERSQVVFGSRSVIFMSEGAKILRKLINYSLKSNIKAGYSEVSLPVLLPTSVLFGTGQLPKFEKDLFKLENNDKYLSPTGETPLIGIYNNSLIKYNILPIMLTTTSNCFRSEVGSAGKDTKGLLRLFQFHKTEIIQICDPKESNKTLESMVNHVCNLLDNLMLSYRKVELCTGDLGFSSSKTIDIEVYFPNAQKYIEVSSISNCLEFQSRRSKIRYKDDGKVIYPHTLNGSSLAIERVMAAIIETHFDGEELVLPKPIK